MNEAFEKLRRNDSTVYKMTRAGYSLEDIIVQLAKERDAVFSDLMKLQLIAPKRIRVGDKEFIYRCPDELVPLDEMPESIMKGTKP